MQYSVSVRDAQNDVVETTIGTAPTLEIRTLAPPANCAAADVGTLIGLGTLPSDYMTASSAGVKSKNGTWSYIGQAAAGAGTAGGHFRIKQGATCHVQGTFGAAIAINTNGTTAANSNVLNFASTTGVSVGQTITGTGVPVGAAVLAFTGTSVTMSAVSTAGVGSGVSISFSGEMVPDNNSLASGQSGSVSAFNLNRGNA